MLRRRSAVLLLLSFPGIFLLLNSCSSGPAPPKMGTPAWYWEAANEQFTAGDLAKTQEHLERVVASDNPYKARAAVWHLVMSSGMAMGYKELAEAYDAGGEEVKDKASQAAEFRRLGNDARRSAKQYCLALAQELESFQKENAGATEFALEFAFPQGSPGEDPALARVRKGMLPPESERTQLERATVKRGVVLETASLVGADGDPAKAADMFKTQPVKVPRAVFLYGLAESLFEESKIFDRKQLNEPDKKKILYQLALDCLKPAFEAGDEGLKKKAKSLEDKIAKEQKTLPKNV